MRRFAVPGLITVIAAALLAVLAFGVAHGGPNKSLDSKLARGEHPVAPSSHMALAKLTGGGSETLAALRGHFVMVNFFAGWCDACQLDANIVTQAEKTLRQHGGTVLGVTFQDSGPDALSFMKRYHVDFPVLRDASGNLASAYGVDGVPETFIINPQGRVVALDREQLTGKWLKTLDRALAQGQSA